MGDTGMGGPRTYCEAFQRTAAKNPDAVAVRSVGGTQTLTWRQYADQVRAVAAGLHALGVRHGDTVALMMANRIEFYPFDVGGQHLGATAFSVYNTLSAGQLGYVLTNAGAKVVVCEAQSSTGFVSPRSRSSTSSAWMARPTAPSTPMN